MADKFEACQNVDFRFRKFQCIKMDEAPKCLYTGKFEETTATQEQCAEGPDAQTASANLGKLITGFCSIRSECKKVGEPTVERVIPWTEKILVFISELSKHVPRKEPF